MPNRIISKTANRNFLHIALLTLAALQLLPIIASFLDSTWLSRITPGVTAFGAVGTVALLIKLARVNAARVRTLTKSEQLKQEVAALNEHALVCLTDGDARLTYVNAKLLEATGYEEHELLDRHVSCLYFKSDATRQQSLAALVNSGDSWQGESLLRTRTGQKLWTNLTIMPGRDDRGRQCGSISVRTDITAVKTAQAQNAVFKALDRLVDEVLIFDARTLRITYLNERAKRSQLGKVIDMTDLPLAAFDPVFDAAIAQEQLGLLRDGTEELVSFQVLRDARPFDVRLQLLPNDAGPAQVMAVMRDVSAQVEGEKVRTEFVSTVSHELRSPMTSIKGAMGLLLAGAGGELPAKARTMLEIAHRNADRLVDIINDLLDIEKISSGNMTFERQRVDLDALIREAMLSNQHFAARFDVKVLREGLSSGIACIDFDRSLQVLNNLLSNAAKFSPIGGRVVVRLSEYADGHQISVQDFGRGIAKDMQGRIFEKFLQIGKNVDSQVRGTGLGLAIVKAIVEQQGGSVNFKSVEGEGTTFYVWFPKASEIDSEAQTESAQPVARNLARIAS